MEKQEKKSEGWFEVAKTFAWALLLAMLFRSFLFEPFHIPSKSMVPNLLVGDFVIVEKYSYGYSRYSFPFGLPILEGRKFYTQPKRGDVVVFKVPENSMGHDIYIKRVMGLPGDSLQMKEGVLYINGKALPQEAIENFTDVDTNQDIPQLVETLPEGLKHSILNANENGSYDDTEEYIVPEGHFFMMGDNRDNSSDSRVSLGYVPAENLIGRAEFILFSSSGWLINPFAWRANRFFRNL